MKKRGSSGGKEVAGRGLRSNARLAAESEAVSPLSVLQFIRQGSAAKPDGPPQLFVSFATAQQHLVKRFLQMTAPRLVDAGLPQPYIYNNAGSGARYGEDFRRRIAERICSAPMGVVFASAEYFDSEICYRFELKLMLWRYRMHGMPLRVVYATRHPYERTAIRFPIDAKGNYQEIVLSDLIDDRLAQPLPNRMDAPLQKLFDEKELDAIDYRLQSLANDIIPSLIRASIRTSAVGVER